MPDLNLTKKEYEELVLKMLMDSLKTIKEYIIVAENHEDGNIHLHCVLRNTTRYEIYSANRLDLDFNNYLKDENSIKILRERTDKGIVHGNYQSVRNFENVVSYAIKDVDELLTDEDVLKLTSSYKEISQIAKFKFEKPTEHIAEVLKKQGLEMATNVFINDYPDLFINHGKRLLSNMNEMDYLLQKEKYKKLMFISPIDNYKTIPVKLLAWVTNNDYQKKALVLWGPPSTGKTEMAKSIAFHWLKKIPFLISDLNGLKEIEDMNSACIIYDDLDLQYLSREQKIHLVDVQETRNIRILYGTKTIPQGTPRIFTLNSLGALVTDKAVDRRVIIVEIRETLKILNCLG